MPVSTSHTLISPDLPLPPLTIRPPQQAAAAAQARAYDAACTPDIYVFDGEQKIYYRGRLDGSRPGNDLPLTGADLRDALDRVLADRDPGDLRPEHLRGL